METLAQAQIELNKKYGVRLIYIAWTIEIVAASIGLFIGISNAQDGSVFYERNKFTNTFIGAAPFIIIAAVELTKIPLAIGVYRVKRLIWRTLFLSTLLLLVFVTFETIFVGLESNFSARETRIEAPRRAYEENEAKLDSIEERFDEINSRTVEKIDDDYRVNIRSVREESIQRVGELSSSRDKAIQDISNNINSIVSGFAAIADSRGTQQKVDRLREDIKKAQDDALAQIQVENDSASEKIQGIDIAIQKIEDNAVSQLINAGPFARNAIRADANKKTQDRLNEKKLITTKLDTNIKRIEEKRESYIENRLQELKIAEEELAKAQIIDSGGIDKGIDYQRQQIDSVNKYWTGLISDENSKVESIINSLEKEKEELKVVQRVREASIPNLEKERIEIKEKNISLRQEIDAEAASINVYRVASRIYGHDSAADIATDELALVSGIWFGSIAFIAAVVGAVLALAGAVLQDPESYKPIQNKKRPIYNSIRRILIILRKFYLKRRIGIIRHSIRSLIVDMRRWFRSPRIKYQTIKVPHEVIKEVPGPEKIVYTEVPKEVIKNEIVYVPFYSVEEGTVMKEKTIKPKKETDD